MIDCLIVGFNDSDFGSYTDLVRSMGEDSGAFRDLNLAFIEIEGKPYRSMDVLNRYYWEDNGGATKPFNNADFLWPVVTYLATYLSKRDLTFDYVNLFHFEKESLKDKLIKNRVLTVAITTTLYVSPHPIIEIVSFVREYNRNAKIIVGGPYISNQPKLSDQLSIQRLFRYIGADIYVVSQEGEAALANIIGALKKNGSLNGVDNIAYREGQEYVFTAASTESNALEDNMVDYGLFSGAEINEFVTLRTAKSCPFSCSFCGFPQRAGKYKYLSVELVERELDAIRGIGGVTTLTFIDDTFNVPKDRFRELLRMMIRNNYGFKWNSFYRSDHGDEETIELMAKAGCEGVFLGIESGSDQMLARMNKTSRRHHYMKAIPLLQQAGISAHANFIVGFPGDTYETCLESISLVEETKPDFFRAQLWYADPVTPIWNKRDEYGVKGSSFNWSHNTMDYQAACDLIDRIFLSLQGSIWLPQNGFEQWSTFYLQRKGMKMDQIKTFLKCFNAVIKRKLVRANEDGIDSDLQESLKASCRFDQSPRPDMQPVEMMSGSNYLAAERYWIGELSGQTSELTKGGAAIENGKEVAWEKAEWMTEGWVGESLESEFDGDLNAVVLAAYGVLLLQMKRAEGIVIVCGFARGDGVVSTPFSIHPAFRDSFKEYVAVVRRRLDEGLTHQAYSFSLLANPIRMALHKRSSPLFDLGYMFNRPDEGQEVATLAEAGKDHPQVIDQLRLVLDVIRRSGELGLKLSYSGGAFDSRAVEELGADLQAALRLIAKEPDVPISGICRRSWPTSGVVLKSDASEEFDF